MTDGVKKTSASAAVWMGKDLKLARRRKGTLCRRGGKISRRTRRDREAKGTTPAKSKTRNIRRNKRRGGKNRSLSGEVEIDRGPGQKENMDGSEKWESTEKTGGVISNVPRTPQGGPVRQENEIGPQIRSYR